MYLGLGILVLRYGTRSFVPWELCEDHGEAENDKYVTSFQHSQYDINRDAFLAI